MTNAADLIGPLIWAVAILFVFGLAMYLNGEREDSNGLRGCGCLTLILALAAFVLAILAAG